MYSERETPKLRAIMIGENWVKNNKLEGKYKRLETLDAKTKIYRYQLSKNKQFMSIGNGKGLGEVDPKLGALFESIEHYIYTYQNHDLVGLSIREITDQFDKIGSYCMPIELLKRNNSKRKIATDIFYETIGKNKFYYPCLLSDVYFTETELSRNSEIREYSSDNGYATGTTRNEAILHGLNELVERDSISLMLLKFGLGINVKGIEAWRVSEISLSETVRKLKKSVEGTLGTKVNIIEMQNGYGIYVFLCVAKINGMRYPLYGAGASLDLEYATIRAITELLQLYLVFDYEDELLFDKLDYQWNSYAKVQNMLQFSFCNSLVEKEWGGKIINNYEHDTVNELVNLEIKKIYDKGKRVYIRDVYGKDGVFVTQVLIPGFENFNLILEGQVILPNGLY